MSLPVCGGLALLTDDERRSFNFSKDLADQYNVCVLNHAICGGDLAFCYCQTWTFL
jgi:hypothetical protein